MTTSTDENTENVEEVEVVEETQERSIDELIDLPYSEMTDEEIERVVQFKADVQTQENLYNAQIQAISDTLNQAAQANLLVAQKASETLDTLTKHAIERFMNES